MGGEGEAGVTNRIFSLSCRKIKPLGRIRRRGCHLYSKRSVRVGGGVGGEEERKKKRKKENAFETKLTSSGGGPSSPDSSADSMSRNACIYASKCATCGAISEAVTCYGVF